MLTTTDDLRVKEIRELSTPDQVMREIPRTLTATRTVSASRNAIHAILNGTDDRLLVVVGPCSIHDPVAAVDYASRLAALRESLSTGSRSSCAISKPRTSRLEGLINDPDLDGSFNIDKAQDGSQRLSAVNNFTLPAPNSSTHATPQYIADPSPGAPSARAPPSQIHRELASTVLPGRLQERTDGNSDRRRGVKSAAQPHHFMAVTKGGRRALRPPRQ